jgi:hypothetical protein
MNYTWKQNAQSNWRAPKFLARPEVGLSYSNSRIVRNSKARSQLSALKRVEGRAKAPGWDYEKWQALVTYLNLHQTNQQVG